MGLEQLGEFGLIDLFRRAAPPLRPEVRQGIGDDCAVLEAGGRDFLLLTTDMLIEGVHFRREWLTPFQIGWKSLAVNLSDIAAMGGEPTGCLLALGLPRGFPPREVDPLRDGFLACAAAYGVDLLGGDTVSSPSGLILCVTAIGKTATPVLRSTARPGDSVFLGRQVGAAAAGLHLLRTGCEALNQADRDLLLEAHRTPRPQLELGLGLARGGLATAMIDVSDGVLQDLGHICAASGLGARLDSRTFPLPPAAVRLGALSGLDPLDWAISGGEDYCLLFCVSPENEPKLQGACPGADLAKVGRLLERPGPPILRGREPVSGGFDHFSSCPGGLA